jgi:hypothetical protein
VTFGLLSSGRRVRATLEFAGQATAGVRAQLEVTCNERRIAVRTIARGTRVVSIDRRGLGPARNCFATVTNTGSAARAFALRVQLSIPL